MLHHKVGNAYIHNISVSCLYDTVLFCSKKKNSKKEYMSTGGQRCKCMPIGLMRPQKLIHKTVLTTFADLQTWGQLHWSRLPKTITVSEYG